MFTISFKNNYQLNKNIEGQFEPFKNERGKLPSFSVCFHKLTEDIIGSLIIKNAIGDYTFYEGKGEGFWFSFCGSYLCLDKTFGTADVYLADGIQHNSAYEASYLLMQAYMVRLVTTGNFMIHSAAAVYKNNAILFCGLSGAGKSTQANLWKKYLHCSILNYDKPCVIDDGENIYAHGSPWSGKERLLLNEYAPLKAIVYVVQSKSNSIRRISPAEAMSNIYLHNYVFPFTKEVEEQYLATIKTVAEKIPVYELSCDISENAVEVLFNTIFENTSYKDVKKEFVMKYRVKNYFVMKQVAEEYIVMPRGTEAISFNAAVVFNEAGAFLWDKLGDYIDEDTLALALQEKYGIDAELAKKDTKAFLSKMDANGLVDKKED